MTEGRILDPFAGSGTALFAASAFGIDSDGIEILPIGQQIIATRKLLEAEFTAEDFETYRRHLRSSDDLVTTYEATRAGFVALALEKNRRATPYVAEARALCFMLNRPLCMSRYNTPDVHGYIQFQGVYNE